MSGPSREQVFSALFALAAPIQWLPDPTATAAIGFKVTSRRIKLFSDVPPTQQPWLGQAEHDEESAQRTNLPYRRTWKSQWIIYHSAGNDPKATPSIMTNQIIDAIEEALGPKPGDPGFLDRRNTLSGLVYKCFIDGKIFKDPGDIDKQAMIVVPITLLVP